MRKKLELVGKESKEQSRALFSPFDTIKRLFKGDRQ